MAARFTLKIGQNLKHSITKPELTDDITAALGAVTWIVPATLFGLSGWTGFLVSFLSTWGIGAAFNIPGMRRAAFAIGATQLAYTHGSGVVQDVLKKPIWRFDDSGGLTPPLVTAAAGGGAVAGLAASIQAGAQLVRMPDGTYAPAYDGMADRYLNAPPSTALAGTWSAGTTVDKIVANTPATSDSPW